MASNKSGVPSYLIGKTRREAPVACSRTHQCADYSSIAETSLRKCKTPQKPGNFSDINHATFRFVRMYLGISCASLNGFVSAIILLVLVGVGSEHAAASLATPTRSAEATLTFAPPGPSSSITHFYTCRRNFYVSTTGSDSNAGTPTSPWLTIQHADSTQRQPGDCIDVSAGTYNGNVLIENGGNAPTPAGYVVYRCMTRDRCHILATGPGHLWGIRNDASFTVIDGFELDGNSSLVAGGIADACVGSDDNTYGLGGSAHHVWVMNNNIHDCNLAGINLSNKEWFYVLHNTIYHNSFTSGYQGSGVGFVVVQCIESNNPACASGSSGLGGTGNYTPSGMDLTYAPPFHNIVSGNVVRNNKVALNNPVPCGSHTDGNGIIMDSFLDQTSQTLAFPFQTLIIGNSVYENGARGIHLYRTSNVTVANNTAVRNGTDTCINAYYLADLNQSGGSNNVWINNIAQSFLTVAKPGCGGAIHGGINGVTSFCGNRNAPLVAGAADGFSADSNNTYLNNVLFGGNGVQTFNNDTSYFSCTKNKCDMNPQLVDALHANFALQSSSPAIGYAQPEPYLPLNMIDVGACPKDLVVCK
jgi:parallel beta-helix repeat protein